MSGVLRDQRTAYFAIAFGAFLSVSSLLAQSPTPPQQPGAGAQVHTGTSSGIDADARIQNLLADHQFLRVEKELDQLPPEQAQLYRGILANRDNNPQKSISLLEPLIDKVAASGDTAHEKLLRKALAEDYLRAGDFTKAAAAYQKLESRLAATLSQDEQDEIEMPLKMLPLAAANPPMTVEPCDSFELQVSRNPLGLTDLPVFVDARPHTWMLDPTAPFNLIARSTAREVGLKVSEESATIHTLTGRPMQVHATLIPRFTIGGRLTLHNVTAFVFEDADYTFARSQYHVQGVLGYPALAALGSLTVTADATIQIDPAKPVKSGAGPDTTSDAGDSLPPAGARFFLDGDQMIVALGFKGSERMFIVDAAGQQTYLTSRYYNEHASEFTGQKMELFTLPGPQTYAPQPAFVAENIPLIVAPNTIHVHYIQVLTQPLGNAALDDVYGTLGLDVLDQLRSYTFNYKTMRFTVGQE
jgi:predicted aspartyl protease